MKDNTLQKLQAMADKISDHDAQREPMIAERDNLIRQAKSEGATWDELQQHSGISSPTSVARALKRGA